jgi:hypothetical protein
MTKWKTDVASAWRNNSSTILLLLLLVAHLPFLTADPDINISYSRGPFTDEGLNTIQARNWINHGYLDLSECDNFLKTPLLGLSLSVTYSLFGTSLLASRIHVLVLLLLALFIISQDRKHRGFIFIFILISLLQYQVFQFSHFSMAEMLACASALLSVHFLARSCDLQFRQIVRRNNAILAALFLSLAYYFKIQFIYLIVLLPLVQIIATIGTNPVNRRIFIRQGFYTSSTLLIFTILYFVAWYLPNRDIYDQMMAGQSGEFTLSSKSFDYLRFNLTNFFLTSWIIGFVIAFLICIPIGFYLLTRGPSSRYRILFLSSFTWFLLETHKLLMVYLPTRYRISLYVSIGLTVSVVLSELLKKSERSEVGRFFSNLFKIFSYIIILSLLTINIFNYVSTIQKREYKIRDANNYMAKTIKEDDIVIGAWAPSLTWDCKARAFPVWNNFLNYKDPVNRYHPRAIVSETDERDSEQAYKSQGINLPEISDSTKTVRIGQWEVVVYYLNPF